MRLSDSDDRPPAAQAPAPTLQDRLGRGAWVNVPSLARKLEWAKGGCSFRVPFHPIRSTRRSFKFKPSCQLSVTNVPRHWPGRLPSSWKCWFHAAYAVLGHYSVVCIMTRTRPGRPAGAAPRQPSLGRTQPRKLKARAALEDSDSDRFKVRGARQTPSRIRFSAPRGQYRILPGRRRTRNRLGGRDGIGHGPLAPAQVRALCTASLAFDLDCRG